MKLILSRKGFDSQSGGCPSPIFPDGTLYSLPIPDDQSDPTSKITYKDLWHGDTNIGKVVKDLTHKRQPKNRIRSKYRAHLDPDINRSTYSPRKKGWRPLFGQSGASQGHLRNQSVQIGDLFLFFGLFRRVEKTSGRWCFVKDAPKLHVLWGWLQIGKIRKVDELAKGELPWARYHHHLQWTGDPRNTLYISSKALKLGDRAIARGAGRFPKCHPELILTEPGKSASFWRLPRCFYPDKDKTPLSSHSNCNWNHNDKYSYVQRTGPGQEFVLDLDQYPGVIDWLIQSIFTCDR